MMSIDYNYLLPKPRWRVLKHLPKSTSKAVAKYKYNSIWNNISPEKDYLLIHIPKNGGTAFSKAYYGKMINHYPAWLWKFSNSDRFAEMNSIAFLREPSERFMSAISYVLSSKCPASGDKFRRYLLCLGNNTLEIASALVELEDISKFIYSCFWFTPQSDFIFWKDNLLIDSLFAIRKSSKQNWLSDTRSINISSHIDNNIPIELERKILNLYHEDTLLYLQALSHSPVNSVLDIIS
ncbi:hypothetical protein ACSYAD_05560 [Acaryochloris marina NIES-2412]|uniref:hypothetical protein n=1 Tax=Acaryochloris marina TaxID=155978 RepID=UPI004058DEB9